MEFKDEAERAEAERYAIIAAQAERKALKRARDSRQESLEKDEPHAHKKKANQNPLGGPPAKCKFLSKAERQKLALERLSDRQQKMDTQRAEATKSREAFHHQASTTSHHASRYPTQSKPERPKKNYPDIGRNNSNSNRSHSNPQAQARANEAKALEELKAHYLGKTVKKKKVIKASDKFKQVFRFDWEPSEDTSGELNALYATKQEANLMFGRGYRAGVDMRLQRESNTYVERLLVKRQEEARESDASGDQYSKSECRERDKARREELRDILETNQHQRALEPTTRASSCETKDKTQKKSAGHHHWSDKPLEKMNERDWRIFREDYDIAIQGGRALAPLRNWKEAQGRVPGAILQAIEDMKFVTPSPIQMQGIPIGLAGRDIIGIAETGSGKTAAFLIPMISYLYALPVERIDATPEQGPLALIMAPTRELAIQIEKEAEKLCKYTSLGSNQHKIKTLVVVGGQPIETQGYHLREGIDAVIGTPGRLMDCLENRYLVLNQCNYVVLDEADRMIDMGFEEQVVTVLSSMGGLLKSDNFEEEEIQSQSLDTNYRVTAMFSATMPLEVERLAKTFLRHPVIVKIGDEDSGKNKRIEQQVMYVHPAKKRPKVIEVLRRALRGSSSSAGAAKIIVFLNLKKECDALGRFLQREGFKPTVLHGGKSQDQRSESLEGFRSGAFDMLVATDVAGRGLDIPDVTHVVNFDLPTKIQNYCHRIGRTGRAGKQGVAISLLTENDTEIMYDLKQYLTSTEMPVPTELMQHPMAKAAYGVRDETGQLVAKSKRQQ